MQYITLYNFGRLSKQVVSISISKGWCNIKPWRWKQRHLETLDKMLQSRGS